MITRRRILAIVIATIVLVPIAAIIFVATFDWNRAKPWLQARASHALGRNVEIGGELDAAWHWRVDLDGVDTFSPGFGFTANAVRIGNPEWAKRPLLAEFESLDIDLKVLPLLWHRVDIPAMRIVRPSLDLEQRKDGTNNWTFVPSDDTAGPAWDVGVGEIAFDAGAVTITDAARDLDAHATIARLDAPIPFGTHVEGDDPSTRREVIRSVGRAAAERLRDGAKERAARTAARGHEREAPPPYLFEWKASGTMHGDKVTGKGRLGGVFALRNPKPFPVRADIEIGATQIALTGTITDPASPDALDMRLWISGPNLAQLYAITSIALPNTPPYATVGRLAGHFHPHRSSLRYEDFTARVGGSDLAGTLIYRSGDQRAQLTGNVDSTLLQFRDLGTLIGAGSTDGEDQQSAARVLPAVPFNVEHWKATDADVRFTGKRIVRTRQLPINDVETRIRMLSGVLTMEPLRFAMAGGKVSSSIRIDANQKPPAGLISLDAHGLQLKRLFEKVDGLSDSLGDVDGDMKLAGKGNSIAALLGDSNGALRLLMTDGRVSETMMEEAGLNLANAFLAKLRGDQQIRIDCAAAALTVNGGVAKTDLFVFDTDNALVEIDGTIDLGKERIDLTLHPHTKGARIFSLRSPLHVQGNFEHLDVSVDKKSLFARGAGAIGLGLVAAPLAALAPMIAPGHDGAGKSCAPLVGQLGRSEGKPSPRVAPVKARSKNVRTNAANESRK